MPILIWGSRGLTSTLDRGEFYCPRCEREGEYALKQVREWFTLYFIPIFPVGGAQRYVECRRCGGGFDERVLDVRPPSDGERLMARLYHDLEEGDSAEDVEERLRGMGMEQEQSRRIADDLLGDKPWTCPTCGKRFLPGIRTCRHCRSG